MSTEKTGLSYRDAGVNIDAANLAVKGIKDIVNKTFDDNVLQDIGSFGAMYSFNPAGMDEPVLVSSVDGVGTKVKIAFMLNRHDTIGIDIVSHCVNDILVQGARPLFFLDYLACGRVEPEVVVQVITGLATGCRYAGCALIGGETAEMPSIYKEGEYDLAGTIVGAVDRKNIVDGSTVADGDVIIGFPSSGLHTNGYSLARKICFEIAGLTVDDPMPGAGRTIGEELLEPHRSYAKMIQVLLRVVKIKGMAHITGGGITENLPRAMPENVRAVIDLKAWKAAPVFKFMHETGGVADLEMLRTFNMGIGYLMIVSEPDAKKAEDVLTQAGQECMRIGRCLSGKNGVDYQGSVQYAG